MFSTAQLITLKALVSADAVASTYLDGSNDIELANWLNTYEPAYYVWRTDLRVDDCSQVMVWTEIDALTNGKARIWDWMSRMGVLNAAKANVRQGIADAFTAAVNTRNALQAIAKRNATRTEKAFATGTGTSVSPAVMDFEGMLSYADASQVRSV